MKIESSELEPTIQVLQGIINTCIHPEIAKRAILVELDHIRKERNRIKMLMEQNDVSIKNL